MIFPSNHHLNHHLKSMKLDLSWLYPVTAIIWAVINLAHTGEKGTELFREYTQSGWMNQINQQAEATSQNPEPIANQVSNLMLEKPSESHHRQKLEDYYQNEDFDGLQSFGEQRVLQLDTEQSPEGEAWRLLNQSPDRYYPDANEHKILDAMELGVKALEHPNTWSKQKDWPTDTKGQPIYDQNSEMSATIARMRQHFKGCDYQKKLILKKDRQVHSPDLKECTRALVTDDSVILHRKITLNPFLEYLSGSGLSGLSACERNSINEQSAGEGCLQIRLGEAPHGDSYYHCGCCIKEETLTVKLLQPEALTHAVIEQARWDDRLQIWLNDQKFWQSNDGLYPLSGFTSTYGHFSDNTSLLATRALAKIHRIRLGRNTVGNDAQCHCRITPWLPKSQYKMSMFWPEPEKHKAHWIGASAATWGTHRHLLAKDDAMYLVWQYRNCCQTINQ